ncbi:MAG: alpha/beta hydrolase [Sneathiella sp.]|uniref:alpha/beta fold hydrolase n=1 Tax=Sneathiella sp. TaxID=1964365 RepID=UPI000C69B396|nr:alpha/beta hydrolase [Sneathiella sp.]MAZ02631.1 alpha/beta hydrolase [Sneathiella sp.]
MSLAAIDKVVTISGVRIETRIIGDFDPQKPLLIFLHEGLGCIELWHDFPGLLCERLGLAGLVYSRAGYGGSSPCQLPRPLDYMEREAEDVLPQLIEHFGISRFILVGHSDGASIALIYSGCVELPPPEAVIAMAPHVFCEDISIEGIAAAKSAYESGHLKRKLERFHGVNIEYAFRGWSDAWLDPQFRKWNIEKFLSSGTAPILVIQGRNDSFGTTAQIEAIENSVAGPFEKLLLNDCGHNPWQENPQDVLCRIAEFASHYIQ